MRRTTMIGAISLVLTGCFGGGDPELPEPMNPRARCDSFAAQAIQAEDPAVATTLAAQASQCYADLQVRQR